MKVRLYVRNQHGSGWRREKELIVADDVRVIICADVAFVHDGWEREDGALAFPEDDRTRFCIGHFRETISEVVS